MLSAARNVFAIEIEALQTLSDRLDETFIEAVATLQSCVERRNKVIVLGVGKSGHIGDKIAATLTSTGCPAVVLHSLNALHGDLGIVSDGDVILALSSSGETEELNNVLPALARFQVQIIALTGRPDSSLGRAAHTVLDVSVPREACPLNLAPTSSTTAMLA
ncbi:MAG: SIS domain-containing protein, partial [Chthoniobacterales bacterium]